MKKVRIGRRRKIMPTCQHCGNEWTWGETLKSMWRIAMKCPYCGEKQYQSAESRKQLAKFGAIPVPFALILPLMDITILMAAGFLLIVLLAVFSVCPFFLKLSNEQEPYW